MKIVSIILALIGGLFMAAALLKDNDNRLSLRTAFFLFALSIIAMSIGVFK